MRVLEVAEVLHPDTVGGAGRVLHRLAAGLAARGHDVRVVSRATPSAPERDAERDGYRIHRFEARTEGPLAAWASTRRGVLEAIARATSDGFRPDVLHGHQPLATRFARGRVGAPLVYTFYSPWPAEYRTKRFGPGRTDAEVGIADRLVAAGMAALEADVLKSARALVSLSRHSAGEVRDLYPGAPEPTVIPGGVDPAVFRPPAGEAERRAERRRFGLDEGAFVALTVRNLVPRMGLEILLEAALEARPAVSDLVVVVAGDGPLRPALEARAARDGLAATVRFLGRTPEADLPALYRAADLFVLPTKALEGFGLVILEAYATGIPVLGTRVGAIPEIVERDGDPEWLVDPRASRLATGLVTAAGRRARLRDPAEVARRRAIAEAYAWDRMVDRYEAIYRGSVTSP